MKKFGFWLLLAALVPFFCVAQEVTEKEEKEGYHFTDLKRIPTTDVKSQDRAGTCWCWSTLSFLESEMIRLGKEKVDLSPMYVVWHTYNEKAKRYVRMHGKLNFGQGGAFADVLWAMKNYGIVPLETYLGMEYTDDSIHAHAELDAILQAYLNVVVDNPNRKLSKSWMKGYNSILDAYLGKLPDTFTYKGVEYTPMSFSQNVVGLNMDDYINLTSFTHHPFYSSFAIEVPDNWIGEIAYNIPIDDLMSILDQAIDKGYSFAWGSDVSEEGFARRGSIAIVPDYDTYEMADAEISKWTKLKKNEKLAEFLKNPGKEKTITQEMRQEAFDNFQTTDDHGMHAIGKATDQFGNKYFIIKNSWGTYGDYEGYFYASYPFVKYKTLNVIIHKDAVPKNILKKLGIK